MRTVFLISALLLVSLCSSVFAQSDQDTVTAAEKKAVEALANTFLQRLIQTGDVESSLDELFARDFVDRYAGEMAHHINDDDDWPKRIVGIIGLDFDPTVFSLVDNAEYKRFYLSTFRFMNYAFMVNLNKAAKAQLSGRKLEEEDIDTTYPQSVTKLLDSSPFLLNTFKKTNTRSKKITTLEDFRSAAKTLEEISVILRSPENAKRAKVSPDGLKLVSQSNQKVVQELGYPLLNDIDGSHFGFPRSTRLIITFATVGHMLVVAKFGAEYKIVYAGIGSPD